MAQQQWTEDDIPDLSGRTSLITGANTGLGLRTARVLAEHGAHIVLACRNTGKATDAARQIAAASPKAGTSVVQLDLASLSSVRSAAEEIRARLPRLDLLINNAGVMETAGHKTPEGVELTLAVNHLGPFALTGLLLDRLAAGARIVTMSSLAHTQGGMNLDDLKPGGNPAEGNVYARSKLANLLFTYELDRRLRAAGVDAAALAAHPGIVHTELFASSSRLERVFISPAMRIVNFWAVQDLRMGALPVLRAATDPAARGGEYYGPRRTGLRRWYYTGFPAVVESSGPSHDEADQARLWRASEELTGVGYAALLNLRTCQPSRGVTTTVISRPNWSTWPST